LLRELDRQLDELLNIDSWPQNRDLGNLATNHCDFIAFIESGAALAVPVDLIGQGGTIFHDPETVMEEKVWNAGEEANGVDPILFSLVQQRLEDLATRTLMYRLRPDDDGPHFSQVRPIKMQCAATDEGAFIGFGNSEIANVLADLRERATQ